MDFRLKVLLWGIFAILVSLVLVSWGNSPSIFFMVIIVIIILLIWGGDKSKEKKK